MENKNIRIGVLDFTIMPYSGEKNYGSHRSKAVWLTGSHDKSGKFVYRKVCISSDICSAAGLKEGDRVDFASSKDHTQLAFVKSRVGVYTLKRASNGSRSLSISSSPLALDIRSASSWGHSSSTDRFKAKVVDGCVVFEREDNE